MLLLRQRLHVLQPLLKIRPDHFLHAEENMHDALHQAERAVHGPADPCAAVLRRQVEIGDVVRLERLDEIKLQRNALARFRLNNFHPPLPDLLAEPLVNRADAGGRSAVGALQIGVDILPWRPAGPLLEIVYDAEDFVRRGLDCATGDE
jgi:hypothetical protein